MNKYKTMRHLIKHVTVALTAVLSLGLHAQAPKAILAATPPMGWNSWNHFAKYVKDADVRSAADAMVSSGMRDAGYVYINIDDGWQGERDPQGVIQPNSKFPDMKALADYVHGKGLKIGIYSSPGPKTCIRDAKRNRILEGSYGHEAQDANTYAAWGFDYLKYDLCSFREIMNGAPTAEAAHQLMVDAYSKMSDALKATGRPIVFSMCQYGDDAVWNWGASIGGNSWRTTTDIADTYASMENIGFSQAGLSRFAAPGHWNDPDMLEVGNGGMKPNEYRTHMALWAMLAAPLLAGNDLSNMSPETTSILTNRDVIAIDQDPLGVQGDRVSAEGPIEIWSKPLKDGSKAIAIFNRHATALPAAIDFQKLGFSHAPKAKDLWSGQQLAGLTSTYNTTIAGHSVLLLRVSK